MDTSSISEDETQSLEAVSMSKSSIFPLVSWSLMRLDLQCSVSFLQLLHHQDQQQPCLDRKGGCQVPALIGQSLGLASVIGSGMLVSPHVEL